MTKLRKARVLAVVAGALATAALIVPAAGVGKSSDLPTKVGKGEGKLTMVAWEGYLEPKWVKPFERKTGCAVQRKYAGSSDEMVALMRAGGGGQYDLVSASGDASLRLIYGGDLAEINPKLVPAWKDFFPQFKSPETNTVDGKHYGISLQWGPNTLLYNTTVVKRRPVTWGALYSPKYRGRITIPDNPIQIADAALYLSKKQPALGIKDPYELTQKQFDAVKALLKQQRPLIKKFWVYASDEISLFKNKDAVIGAAWPYQLATLRAAKVPVADTIPREGATGWLDSWMLSKKAKHPNCAYLWFQYISTPAVQAQQAVNYGETPVNSKACPLMDRLAKGTCAQYHANDPAYSKSIKFWKTPIADCGNGKKDCVDYTKWQQAWTEFKG